jgi:hypothetical protein
MPVYTVHEPPPKRRQDRRGPERFRFVRDGFHWWAFLFTALWMLWHRLWLALLGFILATIALQVGMQMMGVGEGPRVVAQLLLQLLIGLEAGSLRRWTLERNGWRTVGVVAGDNQEAAERRFFDNWTEETFEASAHSAPARPLAMPRQTSSSDVVGLFPEPGGSR